MIAVASKAESPAPAAPANDKNRATQKEACNINPPRYKDERWLLYHVLQTDAGLIRLRDSWWGRIPSCRADFQSGSGDWPFGFWADGTAGSPAGKPASAGFVPAPAKPAESRLAAKTGGGT